MKNRIVSLVMVGLICMPLIGCGDKAASNESVTTEVTNTETAVAEVSTENDVGMANPWRDCTEEASQYGINGFSAPEGATNVNWSLMEAEDDTALPGTMVQLTFDLDNASFVAREQAVDGEEIVDISGMYYDWTATDEGTLNNWGEGNMPCKFFRYIGDDEWVDVCLWFDIETGYAYSLSAQAKDLDGFDIQAVAEQMYDPAKQESAKIPDEDEEEAENKIEAIRGYAEETAPSIDITGCDTFTQIVDQKLTKGMGYANAKLMDTDLLLVSSGTYDNLDGHMAAIDATLFEYKDGLVVEIGKMCSGGTAYPITAKDGYLYSGSNHWICKYAMSDDKLMIKEKASVTYDANGNGTYYYESEDGGESGAIDSAEAEKIFNSLLDEMTSGEVVDFTTVE